VDPYGPSAGVVSVSGYSAAASRAGEYHGGGRVPIVGKIGRAFSNRWKRTVFALDRGVGFEDEEEDEHERENVEHTTFNDQGAERPAELERLAEGGVFLYKRGRTEVP
jgi:hypothetical protein